MGAVSAEVEAFVRAQIRELEDRLPDAIAVGAGIAAAKPSGEVKIGFGQVVTVNGSGTVDVQVDEDATVVEMPVVHAVSPGDRVRVLYVPPAGAVVLSTV
jgi:hypothetical protein